MFCQEVLPANALLLILHIDIGAGLKKAVAVFSFAVDRETTIAMLHNGYTKPALVK